MRQVIRTAGRRIAIPASSSATGTDTTSLLALLAGGSRTRRRGDRPAPPGLIFGRRVLEPPGG